jgi:hypothetical protein
VFITAEQDVEISTPRDLVLTARSINLNVTNDISQGTSGNYIISGKKIFIGASPNDTTQPMVLGGELARLLTTLVQALSTATVLTSTGPAFFDPKVTAALANVLANINLGIFNSTSNFTSKTND